MRHASSAVASAGEHAPSSGEAAAFLDYLEDPAVQAASCSAPQHQQSGKGSGGPACQVLTSPLSCSCSGSTRVCREFHACCSAECF